MAKQDSFTAEEWTLLRLAPSLVTSGTAAADPSGLFASIKEAAAGAGVVAEVFKANGGLELFSALGADHSIPGMPDPRSLLGEGSREQQRTDIHQRREEGCERAIGIGKITKEITWHRNGLQT